MSDNQFDLAIVDPPYGIDAENCFGQSNNKKIHKKFKKWDKQTPSKNYFTELFRVSKNQIIWGGNYFGLPPNRHFLIWRKLTISEKFTMAMCEYAWSSFNLNAKWIEIAPQNSDRFHPTQKPVKLYQWILENYAEQGNKILDTHLGSGSIAIACDKLGYDLTACEINKQYYDKAMQRLEEHQKQLKLF